MTRFEQLGNLLGQHKYFKLVCGAGNEDAEQVEKLSFIYALAGAKGLDISATPKVVEYAMRGVDKAIKYAPKLNKNINIRPFIMVSVGMPGDHHVRKAIINDQCIACDLCIPACPTDAIPKELVVIAEKCIGCGACEAACDFGAIDYAHNAKDIKAILTECVNLGAENIELHAAVENDDTIFDEWTIVNEVVKDNFVSMCLDRLYLSNTAFIHRVKRAEEITGKRLIIQADGIPMSGGEDDYNTTLQAIATADVILKHRNEVTPKILLSGGTNSKTKRLAEMCGIEFHGVAIGTFARKIIKFAYESPDFWNNDSTIENAVQKAEELVSESIGDIIW